MTTPENHPRLESLAAFVDGRLAGAERAQVIEHLARCEDCLEVVAETGAVQEEEEDEASQPGGAFEDNVVVHPSAWKRWAPAAASLAAALVLAVVGAWQVGWLFGPDLSVDTLASRLADSATRLEDEDWAAQGWPTVRGAESQTLDHPTQVRTLTPFEVRKASFLAGVHAVDLQVALQLGERERATTSARELDKKIRELPNIWTVKIGYHQLVDGLESDQFLTEIAERAAEVEDDLAPFTDHPYYQLGKWAEAGRLAALAGDVKTLRSRHLRGAVQELRKADFDEVVLDRLGEIRERLRGDLDEKELERLAVDFREIVGGEGVRLDWRDPAPPTEPADE